MIIKQYPQPQIPLPTSMQPPQGYLQCSKVTAIRPYDIARVEQNELRIPQGNSYPERVVLSFINDIPTLTKEVEDLKEKIAKNSDNKEALEALEEKKEKLDYRTELYGAAQNEVPSLRTNGEFLVDESGKVMNVTQIIGRNDRILGTISPAFASPDRVLDAIDESREEGRVINLIG